MPAIQFVAKFVQVKLQVLTTNLMIYPQNGALGNADSNVNPMKFLLLYGIFRFEHCMSINEIGDVYIKRAII
jgi:hypothetical protein